MQSNFESPVICALIAAAEVIAAAINERLRKEPLEG